LRETALADHAAGIGARACSSRRSRATGIVRLAAGVGQDAVGEARPVAEGPVRIAIVDLGDHIKRHVG
jgi:hypothetical protein